MQTIQTREQKTYQIDSIVIEIDHDLIHNKAEVTVFDTDQNVICSFKSVDEAQDVANAIIEVTGKLPVETPEETLTIDQLKKPEKESNII